MPPEAVSVSTVFTHAGPLLPATATGFAFTFTVTGCEDILHCGEPAFPASELEKLKSLEYLRENHGITFK